MPVRAAPWPVHRHLLAGLVAVLSPAVATPSPDPAPTASTLLVLPLHTKAGVDRDLADQLTSALVIEAGRVKGYEVASQSEIEGALSTVQVKQMAGCDTTSCALEIAGALNAREVVMGTLGHVGEEYVLTLTRFRSGDGHVEARVLRRYPLKQPARLLDDVRPVVMELLGRPAEASTPPPAVGDAPPSQPVVAEETVRRRAGRRDDDVGEAVETGLPEDVGLRARVMPPVLAALLGASLGGGAVCLAGSCLPYLGWVAACPCVGGVAAGASAWVMMRRLGARKVPLAAMLAATVLPPAVVGTPGVVATLLGAVALVSALYSSGGSTAGLAGTGVVLVVAGALLMGTGFLLGLGAVAAVALLTGRPMTENEPPLTPDLFTVALPPPD